MKKYILFFIFGGSWGALHRTQVNEIFRAASPHNRADICITREKNNTSFSYMGHNIQKCAFLAIRGATYKIWKQSDKDFLSYRENDEVSADADAA